MPTRSTDPGEPPPGSHRPERRLPGPRRPPDPHRSPDRWGSGGEDPEMFLEPGQLTAATRLPVPRARPGRAATIALWGLRVLVIVLGGMVTYGFFAQLGG